MQIKAPGPSVDTAAQAPHQGSEGPPPSAPELPPQSAVLKVFVVAIILLVAGITLTVVLRTTHLFAVASDKHERVKDLAQGRPVLAAKVAQTGATRSVTLPGDLKPLRGATIYSKVSGYLKDIRVDKGDTVREGQVLGIVESPETDQQVRSSEADLAVKKQMQDRYRALVEGGVVSKQEMDNAAAAVRSGEADLKRLKALKEYEEIRAPFDGIVTARYADPGALLPAATGATQSLQPLVEVQDMSQVRVMVYVGQAEANYVKVGDHVHIVSKDLPDLDLHVPITRTTRALDARTRTMLVEIDVDNSKQTLAPGLYVEVQLNVAEPSSLVVPSDAVFLRGGKPFVAVLEGGYAHYVPIRTGTDDGHTVRVLEGLKINQVVGLHIGDDVSDGAKIKPISALPK